MGLFLRKEILRDVMLEGGIKVHYTFDLVTRAEVFPYQFRQPYRGERLEYCWTETATDIRYVRELYRYTHNGKYETLIPDPAIRWKSKWAEWGSLPPFTYDELYNPKWAIERLAGFGVTKADLVAALKLWHDKVEPKYANDASYYPQDWEWRRLWIYELYQGCCSGNRCNRPLASPIQVGVHGHTHHLTRGGDRDHALENLRLLCEKCHAEAHGNKMFQSEGGSGKILFWATYDGPGYVIRVVMPKKHEHLVKVGDVLQIVGRASDTRGLFPP